MALEGELKGLDGAICSECETHLELQVCHSAAGYYLGYFCDRCGPYSRETGYYRAREEAQSELEYYQSLGCEPVNLRDTEHHPDTEMKIYVFDSFDDFMDAMIEDNFEEFNRET